MLARLRFSTLQSGLVLFWAVWMSIVTLTNAFDALQTLGVLPESFTFASYNLRMVKETVGAHGAPVGVAAVLFAGVIVWQLLASALLWRGWWAMQRGRPGTAVEVTQGFAVSIALWAALLIATEITVNYTTAGTHKSTLIAQLATLLVVRSSRAEDE
jgi:hypothetical protein